MNNSIVNVLTVLVFCLVISACSETKYSVEMTADVDQAIVQIDGEIVGHTPFSTELKAGEYDVTVTAHNIEVSASLIIQESEDSELKKYTEHFDFKSELTLEGKKVAWIEDTKYKVPLDAGGGLLGYFVSSVTKGGLTERFETGWSGHVISDTETLEIEIDQVEIGAGRYSYKGIEYRRSKIEEVKSMVGSTVEKARGTVNIPYIVELAKFVNSQNANSENSLEVYQAAQLLKLYGIKYLKEGSEDYKALTRIVNKFVSAYQNKPAKQPEKYVEKSA